MAPAGVLHQVGCCCVCLVCMLQVQAYRAARRSSRSSKAEAIARCQELSRKRTWHTLWLAVQSTAPTLTRPFMLLASLFHTGFSCWQCPHLYCRLSASHDSVLGAGRQLMQCDN